MHQSVSFSIVRVKRSLVPEEQKFLLLETDSSKDLLHYGSLFPSRPPVEVVSFLCFL